MVMIQDVGMIQRSNVTFDIVNKLDFATTNCNLTSACSNPSKFGVPKYCVGWHVEPFYVRSGSDV